MGPPLPSPIKQGACQVENAQPKTTSNSMHNIELDFIRLYCARI